MACVHHSCVIIVMCSPACTVAISLHQLTIFGYTDKKLQLVINFEFMVLHTSYLAVSCLFFTQRIYHDSQLVLIFHTCNSVGPSNSVFLDKDVLCTVKCILFAHFLLNNDSLDTLSDSLKVHGHNSCISGAS